MTLSNTYVSGMSAADLIVGKKTAVNSVRSNQGYGINIKLVWGANFCKRDSSYESIAHFFGTVSYVFVFNAVAGRLSFGNRFLLVKTGHVIPRCYDHFISSPSPPNVRPVHRIASTGPIITKTFPRVYVGHASNTSQEIFCLLIRSPHLTNGLIIIEDREIPKQTKLIRRNPDT